MPRHIARKGMTGGRERGHGKEIIGELKRLSSRINLLDAKLAGQSNTVTGMAADLRKLSLGQKEVNLQLEEINELLEAPEDGENKLAAALINTTEQIENFYRLVYGDEASPLYRQAAMMWEAALGNLRRAGITAIEGEGIIDLRLHAPAGTDFDGEKPEGFILKTVECGFIYKDKVVKRASVIVNKRSGIQ